jgi:hypothetical protein
LPSALSHRRCDRRRHACARRASVKPLSIHWDGHAHRPETGDYNLGMKANGFFRMRLDGKNVTSSYTGDGKKPSWAAFT